MSNLKERMQAMLKNVQTAVNTNDEGGNNYFKLTVDSNQNGSAVLRFLPQKDLNELPYVQVFQHYFQDDVTGKVYREYSNTTWGENDIMSQFNTWLWKNGYEDRVRKQKRNKQYFSNVYVVKDPGNPDNEGKVMIYRFGQKIFDKIKEAMTPDIELGEEPINPFDPFNGANFRLKSKQVSGYRNYDSSSFDQKTGPIGSEDEIERILSETYDLTELVDPTKHKKTDEEQINLLNEVFGRDPLWLEFSEKAGFDNPYNQPSTKANTNASNSSVGYVEDDDDDLPDATVEVKQEKQDSKKASDSVDDILADLGI